MSANKKKNSTPSQAQQKNEDNSGRKLVLQNSELIEKSQIQINNPEKIIPVRVLRETFRGFISGDPPDNTNFSTNIISQLTDDYTHTFIKPLQEDYYNHDVNIPPVRIPNIPIFHQEDLLKELDKISCVKILEIINTNSIITCTKYAHLFDVIGLYGNGLSRRLFRAKEQRDTFCLSCCECGHGFKISYVQSGIEGNFTYKKNLGKFMQDKYNFRTLCCGGAIINSYIGSGSDISKMGQIGTITKPCNMCFGWYIGCLPVLYIPLIIYFLCNIPRYIVQTVDDQNYMVQLNCCTYYFCYCSGELATIYDQNSTIVGKLMIKVPMSRIGKNKTFGQSSFVLDLPPNASPKAKMQLIVSILFIIFENYARRIKKKHNNL